MRRHCAHLQAGRYKNTLDVVAKVFAQEGFFGFFKGLEATLWRHATWNGGYFGMIHGVRAALPEAKVDASPGM